MDWIPGSGRSPGGGHGNPLQSSCLENPVDRGAWRAMARGVAKELDMTERLNNRSLKKILSGAWEVFPKGQFKKPHFLPLANQTGICYQWKRLSKKLLHFLQLEKLKKLIH